jgi:hypothetical protein
MKRRTRPGFAMSQFSTSNQPAGEPGVERRIAPRQRAVLAAHIRFNRLNSSYEARVRDVSANGARLRFGDRAELPDDFEMRVGTEGAYRPASVAWRHGFDYGIAFAD